MNEIDRPSSDAVKPIGEYRLRITVRNNLLLSAIEEHVGVRGFGAQARFAEVCGLAKTTINALVSMRELPIGNSGEFTHAAKVIMEVLGAAPSDLWTDRQLCTRLHHNTGERVVSESMVDSILAMHTERMTFDDPMNAIQQRDARRVVTEMFEAARLTKRERRVLQMRYGMDGGYGDEKTLEEIAIPMDLNRERIRQIEVGAFKKIKAATNVLRHLQFFSEPEFVEQVRRHHAVVEFANERFTEKDAKRDGLPSDPVAREIESHRPTEHIKTRGWAQISAAAVVRAPTKDQVFKAAKLKRSPSPASDVLAEARRALALRMKREQIDPELRNFQRDNGYWPIRLYRTAHLSVWLECRQDGNAVFVNVLDRQQARAWIGGDPYRADVMAEAQRATKQRLAPPSA